MFFLCIFYLQHFFKYFKYYNNFIKVTYVKINYCFKILFCDEKIYYFLFVIDAKNLKTNFCISLW